MRVPNRGWDETPRAGRGLGRWGKAENTRKNASWDQTPRSVRGRGSPDRDGMELDVKEWEEEQVRLDRDWYTDDDTGGVVSIRPLTEAIH